MRREKKIVVRVSSESKSIIEHYSRNLGISPSQMVREGIELRIKSAKASFSKDLGEQSFK